MPSSFTMQNQVRNDLVTCFIQGHSGYWPAAVDLHPAPPCRLLLPRNFVPQMRHPLEDQECWTPTFVHLWLAWFRVTHLGEPNHQYADLGANLAKSVFSSAAANGDETATSLLQSLSQHRETSEPRCPNDQRLLTCPPHPTPPPASLSRDLTFRLEP